MQFSYTLSNRAGKVLTTKQFETESELVALLDRVRTRALSDGFVLRESESGLIATKNEKSYYIGFAGIIAHNTISFSHPDMKMRVIRLGRPKSCPRCCGKGVISCFAHVSQGVCFACKGTGLVGQP